MLAMQKWKMTWILMLILRRSHSHVRHDYEDIDIETGGSGSDEMEGTAFVSRHTANTDGQVPAVKRSGMTLESGPKNCEIAYLIVRLNNKCVSFKTRTAIS